MSNLQSSEVNFTSITLTWQSLARLQQNGEITNYSIIYNESSKMSGPFVTTIPSFTASSLFPGTSYIFKVAAVNSEGIGPYTQYVVTTVIPTGMFLFDVNINYIIYFIGSDDGLLKGMLYSNNSVITISDIGQDSDGLFCFTNATNCCRHLDGASRTRDWFYPNDSRVESRGKQPISRSRGPRSLILHRKNISERSGVYRCQIYNISVYFGMYQRSRGNP